MPTLVERLGYAADAKLLVVNCDDLGSSDAANRAIYRALREGVATSATLMVPCPASGEATTEYRGEPVGVHLTLNAEWEGVHWGPLTDSPSLRDERGSLPRTVEGVWAAADLEEVRQECVAQIEAALAAGIDVTHLDSHMGTLQLRADYYGVYLDLAANYRLPLRMLPDSFGEALGFEFRRTAAKRGVVFPDHFVYSPVGAREAIEATLETLRPGVTEVYVHPAIETESLRATHPDWEGRVDDYELVTSKELRSAIDAAGGRLVSFADLRALQRSPQ